MPQELYWRHQERNRTIKGSAPRTTGESNYTEQPDPCIDGSGWRVDWGRYVHGGTRHQQTAVWGEVAIVRHRETASHKFAEWTAAVIAQPLRGTARASSPMVVPSNCSLSGKIVETRGLGATSLNGRSSGTPLRVQLTNNATLADVDKFSYLRGLLIKLTRSAIAGFALTSVNYKAATGLLKRSYGKRTAIQRTHIKDLMNIEPIYSERDAHWLRALCDFAEIKHRALEPLGVTKKHTPPSWCHHCWRNFQSSFVWPSREAKTTTSGI